MNRNKLKAYAPKARRDFIRAVTDRAAVYGLTNKKIESVVVQGDVGLIGGKPFSKDVVEKRKRLVERIEREGFDQVMEAMAYTWFNRFAAIRFMEVHGYLDHGYRVLSTTNHTNSTNERNGDLPEILGYAEHVELPGVDRERVVELKLAGNRDEELYRMLLVGQCNALHKAMPFLFERIGDATELLLPENLLHSDSLIRRMVNEVPEEEWQEVEILGWLYQFYISEKKDQVIGKVVKSEDIPAATQLFTPNWIVKYMVQNTIGRMWLATYPESSLRKLMEYYIEPGEQTPEVMEQLKAITPESLNPEEMTLADVACGSGHILVEGYDLFKAIYQERGYRAKDIPRLILEKNLYGLDIDDRAAQLAAFALMMKARADDRRIFDRGVRLNVMAIQNRPKLSDEVLKVLTTNSTNSTNDGKDVVGVRDLRGLLGLFEHGKTFGSLIRVPEGLEAKLPAIADRVEDVLAHGEMFGRATTEAISPIVQQARILAGTYDATVTNPPYMGSRFFSKHLKEWVHKEYAEGKGDLYGAFILRNIILAKQWGRIGMITIPNWMFISSFEGLRESLFALCEFENFSFNGRGVWGSDFGSSHFVMRKGLTRGFAGKYFKLFDKAGSVSTEVELKNAIKERIPYLVSATDLSFVPGKPLSFWISRKIRECFLLGNPLHDIADPKQGMATGNNDYFVRYWWEVSYPMIKFDAVSKDSFFESGCKWAPYNKGGPFRKWFGNNESVLSFDKESYKKLKTVGNHCPSEDYYFKESITWGLITVSLFSCRYSPEGFVFDVGGSSAFPDSEEICLCLGFLNSKICETLIKALNPTVNTQVGDLKKLPIYFGDESQRNKIEVAVKSALDLARKDWYDFEIAWGFERSEFIAYRETTSTITSAWSSNWQLRTNKVARMKDLEEEINKVFLEAYKLDGELNYDVDEDQITIHRYNADEESRYLISYAIGCMMGRYSLDAPGLIYAHSGNEQFWEIYHEKHNQPLPPNPQNDSCYSCNSWLTFPPDADGIIPITDTDWFPDDAANRFFLFISVAWPKEHLEENLQFIADSLSPNRGESPRETIRRYMATGFFKHHLKVYKKRPIYWLFTSGKLRAFQCLVYLHRYNEGTLSRMRTEYVIPLQGKISARIEQLAGDILAATSTAHRKKLERERGSLIKQQAELQTFDEKLRHYADMRIALDLDDGVKVNYGKFGDLLAEVAAITGKN